MNLERFSNLNRDNKIHYLSQIFLPIIEKGEDMKSLEIFLFWSSDDELIEFYEAILNPEKVAWYIKKQWENLKRNEEELKQINNLFSQAKIEMLGSLDKENADNILNDIILNF